MSLFISLIPVMTFNILVTLLSLEKKNAFEAMFFKQNFTLKETLTMSYYFE